jgi:trehalose 6-phosphate phosphatase
VDVTSLGPAGEALRTGPASAGLILDFDGVLAPIVDDPNESRIAPDAAPLLRRLVKHLGLVAVLSGRPLTFLQERVEVDGVLLLGSYGVERRQDGATYLHPEVAPWLPVVATAVSTLRHRLSRLPGVRVEEKGMAVAAHWRQAHDRAAAESAVVDTTRAIAEETGLRVEPGKLVVELRAPVNVDKGTAVEEIVTMHGLRPVVYVGDDLGDLPAFRAARQVGGHGLLVEHGEETPPELGALCGERFDGVPALVAWLAGVASAIGA